jgi:site-specific DNA-methyltransferase (adenine-specific)
MVATILKGDCLVHMKSLPDKSCDLIICDLPFGCLTGGGLSNPETAKRYKAQGISSNTASGCDWDIKIDLEVFWKEVKRLCRDATTPVLMFCTVKYGNDLINSNPKWFRYDLVWNKERGTSFLSANKMPMRSHEMVYVFAKQGAKYFRKDIDGEYASWGAHNQENSTRIFKVKANIANANDGTKRCALSVITIKKPNTKGHPTEKPPDIYKWLIERYSKEGDTVLDPTAGSFNSGVVAVEMNRKYIGIEMNVDYFNKAISKFV